MGRLGVIEFDLTNIYYHVHGPCMHTILIYHTSFHHIPFTVTTDLAPRRQITRRKNK